MGDLVIRSLKDIPPDDLALVLRFIAEGGILYDDCQLVTKITGLRLEEDGRLHAENFVANDPEVNRYHVTLVTRTRPNGTTYRDLMFIEHDNGKGKIGDVMLEVRLNTATGRYMVHIRFDQSFEDETHFTMRASAKRSSVQNPSQAIKRRPDIDLPGGINSNPARIGGQKIATHVAEFNWADNLPGDEFIDITDFVDLYDSMGLSTLTKALKYAPASLANEIFRQMRDPNRKKFPRKSSKKSSKKL